MCLENLQVAGRLAGAGRKWGWEKVFRVKIIAILRDVDSLKIRPPNCLQVELSSAIPKTRMFPSPKILPHPTQFSSFHLILSISTKNKIELFLTMKTLFYLYAFCGHRTYNIASLLITPLAILFQFVRFVCCSVYWTLEHEMFCCWIVWNWIIDSCFGKDWGGVGDWCRLEGNLSVS